MSEPIIKVKNLFKSFDIPHERTNTIKSNFLNPFKKRGVKEVFHALNDISFEINKGEVLGVVGRNGGGKSTLLKLLAGIYTPSKGTVEVNGRVVPFLELGVGFNPELTGRENVFLNGAILGMTREYLEKIFDEIVDFAEVADFIDLQVKNYSSGMLVRLAFSIAMKADADIYLLDEILGVGDIAFQRKSLQLFNDFKKQGKTIIFVSHSITAIEDFCDKAILLEDSKAVAFGKVNEITNMYRRLMSPQNTNSHSKFSSQDNRWGSGKLMMDSVKIMKGSKEKEVFGSNDTITFKIDYTSNEDLENIAFGISIYREDSDQRVFGTNNYNPEKHVSIKAGKGTIKMNLEAKYLLSSTYIVTVGAFEMSNASPLDYHNRMYQFTVDTDSRDEGVVSLPVSWS